MPDIFETLRDEVTKVVKKGGVREEFILPNETKDDVLQDAIDNAYYDVAEFYSWYFNQDDERNNFSGPVSNAPNSLIEAVRATVKDNLEAARDADEIPAGVEPSVDVTTDNLVGYIVNWRDWYYDRKVSNTWDSYYEQLELFDNIYIEDDYSNDNEIGGLYDDEDVPYKNLLRD